MPRRAAVLLLALAAAPTVAAAQGKAADTLSRRAPLAQVRYLTQLDLLADTKADAERCSAAAALNAFLLLGGDINAVAPLFGLPTDRTVATAHRVQDRLYRHADVDGTPGVLGSTKPITDSAGTVVAARRAAGDEFHRVTDVLGLQTVPLFGATLGTVATRDAAVDAFLRRSGDAVFVVGADADLSRGARPSRVPTASSANHYITIARLGGIWYKVDSWNRPGVPIVSTLTAAEVRGFLYRTPVTPWGIVRAPEAVPRLEPAGFTQPPHGNDLLNAESRRAAASRTTSASPALQPLDLFRIETVEDPQLSPDGTTVVYVRHRADIMRDRRITELWLVRTDGTRHERLTSTDGTDRAPRWLPSGEAIVYLATADDTTRLLRRDVGSQLTTELARWTSSPEWLTLSPDGTQVAYAVHLAAPMRVPAAMPSPPTGAKWAPGAVVASTLGYHRDGVGQVPPGRVELFVLPTAGGTPKQLTSGTALQFGAQYGATPAVWTPDGSALIVTANGDAKPDVEFRATDLYELSLADRKVTPLLRRPGRETTPVVSPDGTQIAFISEADSGAAWTQARLWVMPRAGGSPRLLSAAIDAPIGHPTWTPDGSAVLVTVEREGRTGLWQVTLAGGATQLADSLATGLSAYEGSEGYSRSATGAVAMTRGNGMQPGDIWFAAAPSAAMRQLTDVNADLFAERALGSVTEIWSTSPKDGRRVQSWLITPPGYVPGRKYPLILEIHGGPFAAYGDRFDIEKQLMAAQGYLVLYANPRGSLGYGEAFAQLIDKAYPGDDAEDLLGAVNAVVERGLADPGHLYVTGGSGGGVLTAWLTSLTTRFRAAAVLYPVVDWTSETLTADMGAYMHDRWLRGTPWTEQAHYWARSPLSRVGSVQTPTLVLGGDADERTPFSQSEIWFAALRVRGVPTELVRMPDEPHGAETRPSHQIAKVAHITDWFARHLDAACCAPLSARDAASRAALTAFADSAAQGALGYVDAIYVQRDGVPLLARTFPRNYDSVYPMKAPTGPYNYQDAAWHPYHQRSTLHTLQSVSKSIVAMVYGAAIARGDLTTIDQPIAPFLPRHAAAFQDPQRARITIRHLLTMTSGIDWPEGGGYGSDDDITQRMENSADWTSLVMAQRMDAEPGTKYHYNDGGAALLADVFLGATGVDLQTYAQQHLFAPIGITRFAWKRSSGGLTDSEGGLYLEPESLARLGQLMLDGGVWNGTRILDAAWVQESVRDQQPAVSGAPPRRLDYGLLWWTLGEGVVQDPDVYFGWGYGGQYVMVFPKTRTVAVLNQWGFEGKEIQPVAFARRIEAAIGAP